MYMNKYEQVLSPVYVCDIIPNWLSLKSRGHCFNITQKISKTEECDELNSLTPRPF